MHDQIGEGPNIVGNSLIVSNADNDDDHINEATSLDSDSSTETTVLAYGYTGYEKLFPHVFPKPLSNLITPTQCLGVKAALWLEQELTIIMYLNYCSLFPSWIGIDHSPKNYVKEMLKLLQNASEKMIDDYKNGSSISQGQLDLAINKYKDDLAINTGNTWYTVIYKFVCDNYDFIKSCPLGLIPIVKSDKDHEPDGPWVFFRFRTEASDYAQAQIAHGWTSKITLPIAKTLMEFDPIRVYPIIHWQQDFNDGKPRFVYASQQALNIGENIFKDADSREKVYNVIAYQDEDLIKKYSITDVKKNWNNPFNLNWTDGAMKKFRLAWSKVELLKQQEGKLYKVVTNGRDDSFFGYTGQPYTYGNEPQDKIFHQANRENPMRNYYVMDLGGFHRDPHSGWPANKCFDCELYMVPVDFSDVEFLNKGVTGYPMFNQSSESALQKIASNMIKRDAADSDNPPPDKFYSGIQMFVNLLKASN
jgi:hypothetical protein